jgi:hypothetical protein
VTSALKTRAELDRLARVVDVDAAELAGLATVPPEDLRRLREQVTSTLFDRGRERFARVAGAAKLLPPPVVATIARRAFGPLLAARITGHLDPKRAADIASHLPVEFLADTAVALDPRRAEHVLRRLPTKLVAPVARVLLERDEHAATARYIGVMPLEVIADIIDSVDDGDLLHLAFLAEAPDVLDAIVARLDDERIVEVIHAADDRRLWDEALTLIDQVSPTQRARLADLAVTQDDALLGRLIGAIADADAWETLLPMVGEMAEANRRRLAKLKALHAASVLTAIVEAAARTDRWVELLPLVPDLPAAARRRVAGIAAGLDPDLQRQAIEAAGAADQWPTLVAIAADMDGESRADLVALVDEVGDDAARGLVAALAEDPKLQAAALEVVGTLPADLRGRLAERAEDLGVIDQLGELGAALRA